MLGIGIQFLDAAAHFECVERVVHEFLGVCAAGKRAVVERFPTKPPNASRHRCAGIGVLKVQLDHGCRAQPQAIGISLRKSGPQKLIKQKARFKVRAGRGEFDPANAIAQVELFAQFGRRTEQTLQAPPQVCGFGDVRLGLRIVPAQQKNRRRSRHGGKQFNVLRGDELQLGGEHESILEGLCHLLIH